eukprot:13011017-Alexandrium_andersonii.AAC.1
MGGALAGGGDSGIRDICGRKPSTQVSAEFCLGPVAVGHLCGCHGRPRGDRPGTSVAPDFRPASSRTSP